LDSGLESGFSVRVSITLRLGKEKGGEEKGKNTIAMQNWRQKEKKGM
jgi:hypothetical protein